MIGSRLRKPGGGGGVRRGLKRTNTCKKKMKDCSPPLPLPPPLLPTFFNFPHKKEERLAFGPPSSHHPLHALLSPGTTVGWYGGLARDLRGGVGIEE